MAIPEAVAWKCSVKRVFFKVSQNTQDNSCLIKLKIWGLQLRQRREFFLWVIGKLPLNYLLNLVWFTCEFFDGASPMGASATPEVLQRVPTSPIEIFTMISNKILTWLWLITCKDCHMALLRKPSQRASAWLQKQWWQLCVAFCYFM